MAHLTLEQVEKYTDERLVGNGFIGMVSYNDLMQRFLSYHRWGWAFPLKRKWWLGTYDRVANLLLIKPDAPYFDSCIRLMVKKNQAYGIEPLLLTGLRGIAIRCLSKSSRLVNLANGADVDDEAVTDTLVDLFCYCILALMMIDGRLK